MSKEEKKTDTTAASDVAVSAGRLTADESFRTLAKYSTLCNDLPSGKDYQYHKAFRGFPRAMDKNAQVMLDTVDAVNNAHFAKARQAVAIRSLPAEESKQRHVLDLVDSLLENVDTLLDEAKGEKMRNETQLGVKFGSGAETAGEDFGSLKAVGGAVGGLPGGNKANLRHQVNFTHKVSNNRGEPFRPFLFDLESGKLQYGEAGVHPYATELKHLTYPESQLKPSPDFLVRPLEETPLHFVETPEQLETMLEKLCQPDVQEVAVDLEHHNFHSFLGFTCLMQLSTRTEDFIVDVIAVRDKMYRLNKVFTNPKVLKVLHGCIEDIRWLQKDFGLYIVNLFDTGLALQTLHLPHGLAFLVDHFCQVKLDKQYQTADWRMRPLPAVMVHYARQDTHYLLYCYDRLKQLLLNADARASISNLYTHVLAESKQLCLTQFEKPNFNEETSFRDAMGRSLGGLSEEQLEVVRGTFNWRDAKAREEDVSPPAVMHTAAVLQIACKLPATASEVLKAAQPVSAIVRKNVSDILAIVEKHAAAILARGGGSGGSATTAGNNVVAQPRTSTTTAAGTTAVASSRFVRHLPMSGTLPSVEATFSHAAPGGGSVTAASTSKPASKPSATAPVSGWMKSMLKASKQAKTMAVQQAADAKKRASALTVAPTSTDTGSGVAGTGSIPLPMFLLTSVPSAPAGGQLQEEDAAPQAVAEDTTAAAVDADADVQPESSPSGRLPGDVASFVENATASAPTAASSEAARGTEDGGGKKMLSLRDEYGGLGRDTRRRSRAARKSENKSAGVDDDDDDEDDGNGKATEEPAARSSTKKGTQSKKNATVIEKVAPSKKKQRR